MSRSVGVACAAALILSAGCSPHSFLAPPGAVRPQRVVPGRYAEVAAGLEAGLKDDGVSVLTKRLDGEVRLAGQTKAGKVFCLDVKRQKTKADETVVTVRWDREPDEAFWQTVLEILAVPAPEGGDAPPS